LLEQESQTLRHKLEEYAHMMRESKVFILCNKYEHAWRGLWM